MRSPVPKVLINLLGRPVIGHVLDAAARLAPRSAIVVGGRRLPELRRALAGEPGIRFVRQARPLGTAHAVKQALRHLPRSSADVLILCGDAPLVTTTSLARALARHRRERAEVTVLTARGGDPTGLGRVIRSPEGRLLRIVEEKDATHEERAVREVNAGQYLVRVEALRRLLPRIGRANAQGEYYLTDLLALAAPKVAAEELIDPDEARGINRPAELLEIRRLLRARVMDDLAGRGVLVVDPDLTVVEVGVEVGAGTVIHPFSVIRRGVSIAAHCVVGPFAHLRAGTTIAENGRIGNFVEVKATSLGPGSRALHLAYLGDAQIGAGVNVGAGTVTANFDGQKKHRTSVGDGAMLGSGTVLVAPVVVGRKARTGAGTVVPKGQHVAPGTTVAGVPARPLPAASARVRRARTAKVERRRGGGAPRD